MTNSTAQAASPGLQIYCHACGALIDARAEICPRCGVRQLSAPVVAKKSKLAAGLLGIFLGTFGFHKFYLGKMVQGVIYLLLCWTVIPTILGVIEGIRYLLMSDEGFARRYG